MLCDCSHVTSAKAVKLIFLELLVASNKSDYIGEYDKFLRIKTVIEIKNK